MGEVIEQTTNANPTRTIRHASEKYFISYVCIMYVYSLVSFETLARTLKTFVSYLFECQAAEGIVDTYIPISGHFMT